MNKSLIFLVLCVSLLSGLSASCRGASESDARSAIDEASQRIIICYRAVANATNAGANASALLSVLDDAGGLLSRAEGAFAGGDFNSSYDLALQGVQGLSGFEARTVDLQNKAVQARFVDFIANIVVPIVGTVIVLVGSFVVWSWLKTRQKRAGKVIA